MSKKKPISEISENFETQIGFDFLKSVGRKRVELNSPEYMAKLKIIESNHGGIIKEHPVKGYRVFCTTCDTVMSSINFDGSPVRCLCEHETEERDNEYKQLKQSDSRKKIEHLRSISLLGEKYCDVCWNNTTTGRNESFDYARNRCYKYSQRYEEVQEGGYGLYLWGDKGVGKTHLTACIANSLLNQGIPILFTSLYKISKAIKGTYQKNSVKTEQQMIDEFININFLIFDDLGSEVFTNTQGDNWLQGLLYDLINERYNSGKPTIFTSNHDLNQLVKERKIMSKTVDRIQEMTKGAVMKIQGESWRKKISDKGIPF